MSDLVDYCKLKKYFKHVPFNQHQHFICFSYLFQQLSIFFSTLLLLNIHFSLSTSVNFFLFFFFLLLSVLASQNVFCAFFFIFLFKNLSQKMTVIFVNLLQNNLIRSDRFFTFHLYTLIFEATFCEKNNFILQFFFLTFWIVNTKYCSSKKNAQNFRYSSSNLSQQKKNLNSVVYSLVKKPIFLE